MIITYSDKVSKEDRRRCAAMVEFSNGDVTSIIPDWDKISVTAWCTIPNKARFIVGFAAITPFNELGTCGLILYVRPSKRNHGIGCDLAKIALAQIQERGLNPSVLVTNPASKIILAKLGLCVTFEGKVGTKHVTTMGSKPIS